MPSYAPKSLRSIIYLALDGINKWSPEAEALLMMTAAHESHLGKYLHQIKGPARGIYQMEPATESDIWNKYLKFHNPLRKNLIRTSNVHGPDKFQLQYNPIYSSLMARVHYLRQPGEIPSQFDVIGLSKYAKKYWNTENGKATARKYATAYRNRVLI